MLEDKLCCLLKPKELIIAFVLFVQISHFQSLSSGASFTRLLGCKLHLGSQYVSSVQDAGNVHHGVPDRGIWYNWRRVKSKKCHEILQVKLMSETSPRRVYIVGEAESKLGIGHGWGFFQLVVFYHLNMQENEYLYRQLILLVLQHLLQHYSLCSPYSSQFTFSSLSLPFSSSFSSPRCQWKGALHHNISFLNSVFDGFVLFFCL